MPKFKLRYLYVFFDDHPKQSEDYPTDLDLSQAASNVLQVFRWYHNAYEVLVVRGGKHYWEKVELAELNTEEEIGSYHA